MRLQLALNVPDVNVAVKFYEKMFGVAAAKRKPGYANFEIDDPALKLVLFESANTQDRLNHLGVEVFDKEAVSAAFARQTAAGLEVELQAHAQCCYATQDKVVSHAPDGTMWEWYVKTDDLASFDGAHTTPKPGQCC